MLGPNAGTQTPDAAHYDHSLDRQSDTMQTL